jgi:hypothetical protein
MVDLQNQQQAILIIRAYHHFIFSLPCLTSSSQLYHVGSKISDKVPMRDRACRFQAKAKDPSTD